MPISPNFTSKLQEEHQITFLQCYPNGYLKYTELCNLLQLTASSHADLGGISFTEMQQHHQAWVLSRMRLEILRLPEWKETVTVKTWIQSLENSRSIRCLEMYIGDEKIVGCETFWAVFNTKTRRPEALALPHEHFVKYTDNATTIPVSKVDISSVEDKITDYTVKISDLDIVNHVNNVKYLEWCLNEIEPTVLLNKAVASIDMNFIKEVSLNEVVSIYKNQKDIKITFKIESHQKTSFALEIELK